MSGDESQWSIGERMMSKAEKLTFYEFLSTYIRMTRGGGTDRDVSYAIDKMPQSEFAAALSDYITARFGEVEESEDDEDVG